MNRRPQFSTNYYRKTQCQMFFSLSIGGLYRSLHEYPIPKNKADIGTRPSQILTLYKRGYGQDLTDVPPHHSSSIPNSHLAWRTWSTARRIRWCSWRCDWRWPVGLHATEGLTPPRPSRPQTQRRWWRRRHWWHECHGMTLWLVLRGAAAKEKVPVEVIWFWFCILLNCGKSL